LDAHSTELARGFADESGRFTLAVSDSQSCRIEVTLTGFEPAITPCARGALRIVLTIAPVRESVIVTATRTDTPTSQAGASATVFTAEDLDHRQTPFVAELLTTTPGVMVLRSG